MLINFVPVFPFRDRLQISFLLYEILSKLINFYSPLKSSQDLWFSDDI